MANLTNLEFVALDISGNNYLSWILDTEIHRDAMCLGDTIKAGNKASIQDRAKTNDLPLPPSPRIIKEIVSQLKLCGENITDGDMLEKTFITFHASNIILQQQYREKGFKKYSELISCLLVAERNNKLLLKNHESRPTGSRPFPEANAAAFNGRNRGHGPGRGRGRGRGRGQNYSWNRNSQVKKPALERSKKPQGVTLKGSGVPCFRCDVKGHWSRTCRTPRHLVEFYQASLKEKENTKEVNLVYQDNEDPLNVPLVNTRLDVEDYLNPPNGDNEYSLTSEDVQD
ncbi:hypothetical protein LUZ60_007067 [Juncus effusus]|nr:hypothetical protein LUZ60_007067 [Juncus effusus]